jgi:FeS assembly protein IscX
MGIQWTDIHDIASTLADRHPETDPLQVRFTELARLVQALPGFEDRPDRCSERILEAIQMAWLDER